MSSSPTIEFESFEMSNEVVNIIQEPDSFCCFCLSNDVQLDCFTDNTEGENAVDVLTQARQVFGDQFCNNMVSEMICSSCQKSLHSAYSFIVDTNNRRETLLNLINDIECNIEKIQQDGNLQVKSCVINIAETNDKYTNFIVNKKIIVNEISNDDMVMNDLNHAETMAKCQYCSKILTKRSLSAHLKLKHSDEEIHNFMCTECIDDKPCPHVEYLDFVMNLNNTSTNVNNLKFPCMVCNSNFNKKNTLIAHINRVHLNIFPHECDICGEQFNSQQAELTHRTRNHDFLECKYCEGSFEKVYITDHTKACSQIKRHFTCDKCPVSFDDLKSLLNHEIKHDFECKQCGKLFISNNNLKTHYRTHVGNKTKKKIERQKSSKIIYCYRCPGQFGHVKELSKHLKSNHTPYEPYKCNVCKKDYTSREKYLCHIKSYIHMKREDPNYIPAFQCEDCEMGYSSQIRLDRHRNVRHLKIIPYTCEKCGKTFATKGNLKTHLIRHTNLKNFQCNFCSALFTEATGLNSHILRSHAPEKKKYVCEVCSKTFISVSECKVHQLRQHSEKNLECPLCKGMFHTNANRRIHIKKVHLKMSTLTEFMTTNGFNQELEEIFRDRRKP